MGLSAQTSHTSNRCMHFLVTLAERRLFGRLHGRGRLRVARSGGGGVAAPDDCAHVRASIGAAIVNVRMAASMFARCEHRLIESTSSSDHRSFLCLTWLETPPTAANADG
jgi:hypothetical protein